MNGYGVFLWNEGKKFCGFYQNDKKDGFGIYFSPPDKYYVGFWKKGKQEGFGLCIYKDKIKYGIWRNDKIIKKYENEEYFYNDLILNNIKPSIFQWDFNKIKNDIIQKMSSKNESQGFIDF